MKTAVDIAFEKLANQGLLVTKDYKNLVAYREAKEMEKEQRVDDYVNGMNKGQEIYFNHQIRLDVNGINYSTTIAEQYFNETYGGN